jgi:Pyruvate/2-oxoacid:ferredoxin oxidoreductase gamma subunit
MSRAGAITYGSNTPSVATIDASTGLITLVSAGTVTFTASQAETTQYNATSVTSNELTVALGTTTEHPDRFATEFAAHLDPDDISIKLAGAGGDGAQTAAMLITRAAIAEGFDATHIPSYGPESRGGTSYADVHVARTEVLAPAAPHPHVLVAFNSPSLTKFGPAVRSGGVVLYDSSIIGAVPDTLADGVRVVGVPFTEVANGLGSVVVKNVVALGALQAVTELFPADTFLAAIRAAVANKADLAAVNEQAFTRGAELARSVR